MNQKKLNPSESDLKASIYAWTDKIDTPPKAEVDKVPEGWVTMKQLADHKKVPLTTMYSRVARHLKAGTMQQKEFLIHNGRCTQYITHYYKK